MNNGAMIGTDRLIHIPRDAVRSARRWVDRRLAASWLKTLPLAPPLVIAPGSRVAVVGNGPIAPELGSEIDGHDIVIRINRCDSYGAGGQRTDILVIRNTSTALAYDRSRAMNRACVGAARLFWLAIPPAVAEHDCTEEILTRYVGRRPWQHFSSSDYSEALTAIRDAGAPSERVPSTGLLALWHLRSRHPSVKPALFGFSHSGTPKHAWDAERQIVNQWSDWVVRA